jgi:hypothetical protein
MMRTFSLFTTDERYSVPTFTLVVTDDETSAMALANRRLAESTFHTAVEVREGDRCVCRIVARASRPSIGDLDQVLPARRRRSEPNPLRPVTPSG